MPSDINESVDVMIDRAYSRGFRDGKAAPLDVERLARALAKVYNPKGPVGVWATAWRGGAESIAAAYNAAPQSAALPSVEDLAAALREADAGMRNEYGRMRSRTGFYWRDLAALILRELESKR